MQRPKLISLLVASAALLAGCTSAPDASTTPAPTAHAGTAPAGADGLKAQALALYVSTPFTTTNDKSRHNTPEHSWLDTNDGRLTFLHWDHTDPAQATGLLFTGEGLRGKNCLGAEGVTQEEYDAGFVHFHSAVAPNWDAGHNAAGADGAADTEGWWLRHIGAATMSMTMMGMPMDIEKGRPFPMMPADLGTLQACSA